ncbi:glucose/quinate/shikimate family membrane-bound PQQ-dependent dehydrogenase [Stutzerimonas azotifigens]|uniref:Glucose/quinate/shikimate family membrane-bound PQQ-dependent dehydrogenase n=1 Tax=Stutzerimonas azotifigens TaxID=291995 RepID=A0ABR5YWX0_9GAMM|nr:glucose/quinate/shikimate family membrane-bound PQQ-dependent dehydrogenase [Stutzerimonas azotifigens]MBA1272418.1 glucose/quinate/shikimate family membrane-bound PQQ-dependent dehydrogenase [Stutzerimonas azotifigens]
MAVIITGIFCILLALGLGYGGFRVIDLGGTWYFFLVAIGLLATGLLLLRRRRTALWVYSLVMIGTLVWALIEVGFDWWQLAPRGSIIAPLGLWLLMPWVIRKLSWKYFDWRVWGGAALPLMFAVVLWAAAAFYALTTPSHEIRGMLPPPLAAAPIEFERGSDDDWPAYGRTQQGMRYSPLEDITVRNVDRLEEVWHYHTGDLRRPTDPEETTYEVTPLKIGASLYLCTPHNLVIALDADNGTERWRHDPQVPDSVNRQHLTCRGLAYHQAPARDANQVCASRLFMPTADARLLALDARTGQRCPGFGEGGQINLWANMPNITEGFYYSTSPPIVARGLVIIGGAVNDNVSVNKPSGVIRAYDVNTGELKWNWDAGNPEQTAPIAEGQTYTNGSPNSWSIASADEALGLIYIPMGNEVPDQWGGNRGPNTERFSSSIVALDIDTGALRWVFQTVRHDLWDMDVPAQPSLVDIQTEEGLVPALVAPTKQGDIYVLDRRNGEPVLPVEEVPAPQGAAKGDRVAATQPASALSYEPPKLQGNDLWGVTLVDQMLCHIQFHSLRYDGRYTPPSEQGSLIYPGNFGVFNWGGVAVDPVRQMVFSTPAYLAFTSRLVPRQDDTTTYVSDKPPFLNENFGAPFAVELGPFVSPIGLPCTAPPWGYVAGADLRTGRTAWQRRNGTVRDLTPLPLPFRMGVPSLGGPIVTAGGVAFLSGTLDYYLRAYDVTNGRELWKARLPAGGQATPMTYRSQAGRQIVVVVAGGHGSLGTKAGDSIIAYALPR